MRSARENPEADFDAFADLHLINADLLRKELRENPPEQIPEQKEDQ